MYQIRWLSDKSRVSAASIFFMAILDSSDLIAAKDQHAPVRPWSLTEVTTFSLRKS